MARRRPRPLALPTLWAARHRSLRRRPPRLLIVGAVHISQALAHMAAIAGYAVSIIDPRGSFATEARFPGVN